MLASLANGNIMLVGPGHFIYDTTAGTWSSVTGTYGIAALTLRDGRILFWGVTGVGVPTVCYEDARVYDPATDMTQFIYGNGTCLSEADLTQAADGRVILHGGCPTSPSNPEGGAGYVFLIDVVNLTQTLASPDSGTAGGFCSGAVSLPDGERLYVGSLSHGSFPYPLIWSPQVSRFDPLHLRTKEVHDLPVSMVAPRSVVSAGGKVIVVAGSNGSGLVATTYAYDVTTDRWASLTAWPGSFVEDATVLDDGSVLAVDNGSHAWRLIPTGAQVAHPAGATYHPLAPARVLDSRFGTGLSGEFSTSIARTFQVAGVGGVPGDAVAVTGNLTATHQTTGGYVGLGPVPTNAPTTSSLNFPVGDNRGNGVTVALAADGSLSATFKGSPGATTDLIFDVTGYFEPDASGATYHPLAPARVLDSRFGTGLSGEFSTSIARTFQVAGVGGVPGDAVAVTGNLTATHQTTGGYVGLGPVPTNAPTTSSLNFPVGDNRGNGVTVALAADGSLSATFKGSPGATTDLIFDVTGYFEPDASGATYHPLAPARVLDSRFGYNLPAALRSAHAATLQVSGPSVPFDAVAVTGNLTVTAQTSAGYVALTLAPVDNPSTSSLNFPKGDTRGNGVVTGLGINGTSGITFRGGSNATAQVIFDVTGYYEP